MINVPFHWSPDLWPPSSSDCNPLDYYVWGVVEAEVNKVPHNTLNDTRAAVVEVMGIWTRRLIRACGAFRSHLEAIMAAEGGHFE